LIVKMRPAMISNRTLNAFALKEPMLLEHYTISVGQTTILCKIPIEKLPLHCKL
jgi:hypothetical protein